MLPTLPDWGWNQGKADACAIEVKMVQEEVLTKEACQSSLGKEGMGWEVKAPQGQESMGS